MRIFATKFVHTLKLSIMLQILELVNYVFESRNYFYVWHANDLFGRLGLNIHFRTFDIIYERI